MAKPGCRDHYKYQAANMFIIHMSDRLSIFFSAPTTELA